jgi:hypothetical protein
MKIALLICAASFLFPSTATSANEYDLTNVARGNGLFSALSRCPANGGTAFGKDHWDKIDWQDCVHAISYTEGAIDTWNSLGVQIPGGVSQAQKLDIVYAFLKIHANVRQRQSVNIIYDALVEAFPEPKVP